MAVTWPVAVVGGVASRLAALARPVPRLTLQGWVSMDCGTFLELLPKGPGAEAFGKAFVECLAGRHHGLIATVFTITGLSLSIIGVAILVRDASTGIVVELKRAMDDAKIEEAAARSYDTSASNLLADVLIEEFRKHDQATAVEKRRKLVEWLMRIGQRRMKNTKGAFRWIIVGFVLQIIGALLR